ncbi:MAG: hypothetical protein ACRDRZ_14535 [Pseudonocardiaceae bacterium]
MAEEDDQRPVPAYPDSMGPDIHSGGEQELGGLVPPYEGRLTEELDTKDEFMDQVYSGEGGTPGPGREISETEQAGVPATDTTGASPLGVGESKTGQGNEQSLGDSEEDRRKDREEASMSPATPIDPSSPNMP